MNKKINFDICKKYIFALKEKLLNFEINGENLKDTDIIETKDNKVIIIESLEEELKLIIIDSEEGFITYYFENNKIIKKEILASLEKYFNKDFKITIVQTDSIEKIIKLLEANPKDYRTVHEEIEFEVGFRLRKSFTQDNNIIIFYWEKGALLLSYYENGEEVLSLGVPKDIIRGEKALEFIRNNYKDKICSMKILNINGLQKEDDEKRDKKISIFEEESEEILVANIPLKDKEKPKKEEKKLVSIENLKKEDSQEKPHSTKKRKLSLEESVVITDKELPELTPDDVEIFKKYGIEPPKKKKIILEDNPEVPLDNVLSEKELEIFKKYGIPISTEEPTTCQKIREQFEESVIVTDKELPPIGPEDESILRKYGIILKEESSTQTSKYILNENDVKVLKKYGIKLPKGQASTLEDIKRAYELAIALKKLPKKIDSKDKIVFMKFGLEIPKTPISHIIAYFLIPIIVILMIYLGSLAGKIYREKQLREKMKKFCEKKLKLIEDYKNDILKNFNNIKNIINILKKKYPIQQGYPEPNPKIYPKLKIIENYIAQLNKTIEKGNEYIEFEEYKKGENYFNSSKIKEILENYKKIKEILKKVSRRVKNTFKTAKYMFERREQERKIRKVCRKIREKIVEYYQKMKTLEENWSLLTEKYPVEKGFPPPPEGIEKSLKEVKEKIKKMKKRVQTIELAMVENIKKALSLSQKCLTKKERDYISILNELNENVIDHLNTCEKIALERKLKKECLEKILKLEKISEKLNLYLDKIEISIKKLNQYPIELNVPRPDKDYQKFLKECTNISSQLKKTIKNARSLLYQNNFKKSLNILEKYLKIDYPLLKLRKCEIEIEDAVKIARSMQKKSILGKKLANLLKKVKNIYIKISSLNIISKENLKKIKKYTSNFKLNQVKNKILIKSFKIEKQIENILKEVEKLLNNKQLEEAVTYLEKKIYFLKLDTIIQLIPKLENINKTLENQIKIYEKLAYERKLLNKINKNKNRIEDYKKDLLEQIKPIEENLKRFKKDFPKQEGYPQPPKDIYKALKKGKSIINKINNIFKEGNNLIKQKKLEEALEVFKIKRIKYLLNRDLIAELSKHRYKLDDIIYEATILKSRREKIKKIKNYLSELKARYEGLKKLLPKFIKIVKIIKEKYPVEKGFFGLYEHTDEALTEGKYELKELGEVIEEGETYLHSGEYKKAISLLAPYSNEVNPGLSKLPLLKNLFNQAKKTLEKNRKMVEDKDFQRKIKEKLKKEKLRRKMREKWTHSPGKWYDILIKYINRYEKLVPIIEKSLNDQGSVFLFYKIKSTISELKRIPKDIADLEEMLYNIKQKGDNLRKILRKKFEEAILPRQKEQIGAVREYLKTRKIIINIDKFLSKFKNALKELENYIKINKNRAQMWIPRDILKKILKAVMPIESIYKEHYQPINSLIINIEASLINKNK